MTGATDTHRAYCPTCGWEATGTRKGVARMATAHNDTIHTGVRVDPLPCSGCYGASGREGHQPGCPVFEFNWPTS